MHFVRLRRTAQNNNKNGINVKSHAALTASVEEAEAVSAKAS
jgi:hypothetical protein